MKNVLITGVTGFVGSNLAKTLLENDPEIHVVGTIKNSPSIRRGSVLTEEDMSNMTICVGDILDFNLMERIVTGYEIDTIFALASQSIVRICNDNPFQALYTNVIGNAVFCELARRYPKIKQVVMFSSDKSYGETDELPYKEDITPLKGLRPYESTKTLIDLWYQMYQYNYKAPVTVIRSANIFGPGDPNSSRLIPQVCTSIAKNQNPWLWNSVSEYIREFVYIDDVVDFLIRLVDTCENYPNLIPQCYNLGSGNVFKIKDMVDHILKISGSDLNIDIKNKDINFEEIKEQYLSLRKTKELLNWKAKYVDEKLDEALIMTYNYYSDLLRM